MSFWERIQWSAWKVQAFFGDEDAAIHADSLAEVTKGATAVDREINQIVDSQEVAGPRIPIFSDLKDALVGAVSGLKTVLQNLPLLIGIVIAIVGGYILLMGWKGKKIL
jgi:hypothetical protein